ncbi:MAG: hypothetical protein KDD44_00375 [Bdellovibrionales bacterium]|nr:hypothetical protein [Bdellovibrionales bacterium]
MAEQEKFGSTTIIRGFRRRGTSPVGDESARADEAAPALRPEAAPARSSSSVDSQRSVSEATSLAEMMSHGETISELGRSSGAPFAVLLPRFNGTVRLHVYQERLERLYQETEAEPASAEERQSEARSAEQAMLGQVLSWLAMERGNGER